MVRKPVFWDEGEYMKLFGIYKRNKGIEHTGFQFYGSGIHSRSDEEMRAINAEEADAAFKRCKKEILDAYMKEKGFSKHNTANYARLNDIGLIEYVNLQKEARGSRTVTLNISLFPLYAPHPFITIGFGERIGELAGGRDFWWDYKDADTAKLSFENIVSALEECVMPWFARYNNETLYEEDLHIEKYRIGHHAIIWRTHLHIKNHDIEGANCYLDSVSSIPFHHGAAESQKLDRDAKIKEMKLLLNGLDNIDQYISAVKSQNIEKLKLPAKLKNNANPKF